MIATSRNELMFWQAVGLGHDDVVEHDVGVLHAAQRLLALDLGGGEARGGLPHDEALHLVVGGVARPDHDDVGEDGVADPALRAVQHPLVAAAACAVVDGASRGRGLESLRRVGAVAGLGEAEGADDLAAAHALHPLLALLGGAADADGVHGQTAVHADEGGRRRIDPRDLEGDPGAIDGAVLELAGLGPGGPEQAELGEAGDEVARALRLLPEVVGVRDAPPGRGRRGWRRPIAAPPR